MSYNLRFVDATNWAGIGDLNKTGDNTATHIYASARFSNDRTLNGRFDISFFLPGNTDGAADTSVFYSGS